MTKEMLSPRLTADILDSLNYLAEINSKLEAVKQGNLSEQEFVSSLSKRSEEYGYISSLSYTMKTIEALNQANKLEEGLILTEEGKLYQYKNKEEMLEHVKEMEEKGWKTFKLAGDLYKFIKTVNLKEERD